MSFRMRDLRCDACGVDEEDVLYGSDDTPPCGKCGGPRRTVLLAGRAPGIATNGRGVRSSGEALDRGTGRLAAMTFGQCIETGRFVDTPDGKRAQIMRAPQTEGELDRQLLIHGKRRGTVNELNQQFEEKKAQQGKKRKPVARKLSEMPEAVHEHIYKRPEIFRSQYDAGLIPKKEIPTDIASRIPKSVKGV